MNPETHGSAGHSPVAAGAGAWIWLRPVFAWSLVAIGLVSAIILGGKETFGRLALALGLDGPAAELLVDPLWRGIALHRSGAHDEAAEAFRQAGPRASYNRGNALALAGRYEEAVAAYDAVIYRNPDDQEAHWNRALVMPFATSTVGEVRSGGRIRAGADPDSGAGDRQRPKQAPSASKPLRHEDIAVLMRKLYKGTAFEGQSVVASREWLATLPDEPGRYLKRRIAAERQRRIDHGLSVVTGGDPW